MRTDRGNAIEKSRDIVIEQTLEVKLTDGTVKILATATTCIWPKADINRRDFVKDVRFEPKGGASVKQQMGKRKKGTKGKKGIRQKEAKVTQATNALKEALAVFVKSGCSLEVAQEIVREAFRKKRK